MYIQRRVLAISFLLLAMLGSAALAVALWDHEYPYQLWTWWQGGYVPRYFRYRLWAYLLVIVPLGVGMWVASVGARVRSRTPLVTALWEQGLPYALLLFTPLNAIRYAWHPFGTNPGSALWTYTLILPLALTLTAQITPLLAPASILRRRHPRALWALILLFIVTFGGLGIARHLSFNSHALDLGTMAQAAWNTAHGRILEYTPLFEEYTPAPPLSNRLVTGKLELIFLLIAPLYRLFPTPILLIVLQALALGLSAWPLYHTLHMILRSQRAALFLAAAYLFYLPLHYVVMADFHPSALAPFFLTWAVYFWHQRRWRGFVLALLGALLCRVDVAFVLGGMALLLLYERRWRMAAVTLALAAGWFYLDFFVIVPWAEARYGPDPVNLIGQRFGRYGDGPIQIMVGLLTHPRDLVALLLEREKIQTFFDLLAPVGWLPLFALPWLLPAAPLTFLNLLAESAWQGTVRAHYFAPILPFLFLAAAHGIRWLHNQIAYWRPPDRRLWGYGLALYVLISVLLVDFFFSPFPPGRAFRLSAFWTWSPHHEAIRRVMAQVEPDSRLSAQSNLLPHLAHRRYLYLYPSGDQVADEILLDLDFSAERAPLDFYAFYQSVEALVRKPEFGLKAWDNGVLLLARGYPHDEERIRQLRTAYDEGYYRVRWLSAQVPKTMDAREVYRVRVCLQNVGTQGWRSIDWHPTFVSYHWLDREGNMVVLDGERTPFLTTLYPTQRRCLRPYVYAPEAPGVYILQFDLVREQIAWFSQKGADTLEFEVEVK